MNVVDSSAWLAYFLNERHAGEFAQAIEDLDRLLVPSITLTEVFRFSFRHWGEARALSHLAQMHEGTVIALDSQLAVDAAEMGLAYQLPLADSIVYATARLYEGTV